MKIFLRYPNDSKHFFVCLTPGENYKNKQLPMISFYLQFNGDDYKTSAWTPGVAEKMDL